MCGCSLKFTYFESFSPLHIWEEPQVNWKGFFQMYVFLRSVSHLCWSKERKVFPFNIPLASSVFFFSKFLAHVNWTSSGARKHGFQCQVHHDNKCFSVYLYKNIYFMYGGFSLGVFTLRAAFLSRKFRFSLSLDLFALALWKEKMSNWTISIKLIN